MLLLNVVLLARALSFSDAPLDGMKQTGCTLELIKEDRSGTDIHPAYNWYTHVWVTYEPVGDTAVPRWVRLLSVRAVRKDALNDCEGWMARTAKRLAKASRAKP